MVLAMRAITIRVVGKEISFALVYWLLSGPTLNEATWVAICLAR